VAPGHRHRDLLHCARIAYDRAAGKPGRKRKPADPAWLAGEVDAALSAAWEALSNADDGTGRPFWKILPSPVRPRADDAESEETIRYASFLVSLPTTVRRARSVYDAIAPEVARIATQLPREGR